MGFYRFRVSTKTLDQLEEISKFKKKTHREIIEENVERAYKEVKESQEVYPKKEYKCELIKLTEKKPPYKVEEEQQSVTGLSQGAVKLDNCETPIPASWLEKKSKKRSMAGYLIFWVILQIVLQVIITLLLL